MHECGDGLWCVSAVSTAEAYSLAPRCDSTFDSYCTCLRTGTTEWRPMEAKLFRRGFRENKKRFDIIQKDLSGKSVNDVHEYYYMWKKMKPAEYRGRQRHHSDDDVSMLG